MGRGHVDAMPGHERLGLRLQGFADAPKAGAEREESEFLDSVVDHGINL